MELDEKLRKLEIGLGDGMVAAVAEGLPIKRVLQSMLPAFSH